MDRIVGHIKVKNFLKRGEQWFDVISFDGEFYTITQEFEGKFIEVHTSFVITYERIEA